VFLNKYMIMLFNGSLYAVFNEQKSFNIQFLDCLTSSFSTLGMTDSVRMKSRKQRKTDNLPRKEEIIPFLIAV
jgi:hypothetical protein